MIHFQKTIARSYIQVKDTNSALALWLPIITMIHHKTLLGITGTNGKTTIASLLYQLFKKSWL
jgi:UDP-N-acetylmuramoyl-L-alanyl-D-glutamate--2,6-diaminopimelate ligase